MADIKSFPIVHHLRSEPIMHALRYRRGRLVAEGRGLAFWFRPLPTAVAEVPLDDRELPYLFHGRSADFQDVTVQGTITYRMAPERRSASTSRSTSTRAAGRARRSSRSAGCSPSSPSRWCGTTSPIPAWRRS